MQSMLKILNQNINTASFALINNILDGYKAVKELYN